MLHTRVLESQGLLLIRIQTNARKLAKHFQLLFGFEIIKTVKRVLRASFWDCIEATCFYKPLRKSSQKAQSNAIITFVQR